MEWFKELVFNKDPLSLGLSKTKWHLTSMVDPSRKKEILAEHRHDALVCLGGLESVLWPLEELAMLVEEDLCLLLPIKDEYVLVAASVCAPSRWSVKEKLGKSLYKIHGPVPHYSETLDKRVNTYLFRSHPGQLMARRNWSLHEQPDLYAPKVPNIENVRPSDQWLRSERQTLVKLPKSNAVLFTILIEQTQMKNLTPDLRKTMATHLEKESVEVAEYHGRPAIRQQQIIDWLNDEPSYSSI